MKSNKILLCLDWSNILFRSLFINQLYGAKTSYDNIEDCQSFIYKFATDVCSIINIFKPNNVILLTDSQHAWRKDVLPGEDGYKSNRQRQEGVNWDNIFKCSDDLKQLFHKAGCHVAEYDHSEADDMAALCKEVIFEKYHDYNIIIVSADADLRQLIDFDPLTNQYCTVYTTIVKGKTGKRFLYVTQEMKDWIDKEEQIDIFFSNIDNSKQYIKDIVTQNTKIDFAVENPNEVLLHKIFCGDDGDCVPAFYSWIHNGKNVRITPAKERKIRDVLGIKNISDLIQAKDNLKPLLETIAKKDVNDININERLNRQRTLVELNSSLFPEPIQSYKNTIEYMIQDGHETGFYNMKAAEILKGTEYENSNKPKVITAAGIFKDMEKYGLTTVPIF